MISKLANCSRIGASISNSRKGDFEAYIEKTITTLLIKLDTLTGISKYQNYDKTLLFSKDRKERMRNTNKTNDNGEPEA